MTSAAVVDAAPAQQTQARGAGLTTVALPLTEAAWTSTRAPRRVMHSSPRLLVRKRSAETFLKFDTSALGDREMESIKLQLWAVRGKARLNGLVVQQTFTQWKAENVSHDNRPRLLKAHLNGRARKSSSGRWVNVRLVRTPVDLPGDKIAFRLKIGRKALGAKVFARKGKKAPRLAVVTSIEQTPPGPTPAPSPATAARTVRSTSTGETPSSAAFSESMLSSRSVRSRRTGLSTSRVPGTDSIRRSASPARLRSCSRSGPTIATSIGASIGGPFW